ncbi:MAG TPA: hypothetical protein VIJ84_05570 [Gaiellaceae bacterium]
MRVLAGLAGAVVIVLTLAEFFVAFLLPRRVRREPRIARMILVAGWRVWRFVARRLPARSGDTMLGFYGPLLLLFAIAIWALALIFGFALLQWAGGSHIVRGGGGGFDDDLFFSAGGFLSASMQLTPSTAFARALFLGEAACGFGVLFVAIGYLPAIYQASSRREVAVAQLAPRAGTPPAAGALIVRSGRRGGWPDLDAYLAEWEDWAAELMETHLSYPALAYFRSQHVGQNWLAALTTVIDACAFAIAAAPDETDVESAEITLSIGRHALADVSLVLRAKPGRFDPPRLGSEDFAALWQLAAESGLDLRAKKEVEARLNELRSGYEPLVAGLARALELNPSSWLPPTAS